MLLLQATSFNSHSDDIHQSESEIDRRNVHEAKTNGTTPTTYSPADNVPRASRWRAHHPDAIVSSQIVERS
jgi:hypothetical protein